jgi:hypothetical protein
MSERQRLVDKVRNHLLRRGLPRFEMTVIVAGTGLAGFAASVVLLDAGISSMAMRYPLSVAIAYVVFLGLLRLWVEYHRRRFEIDIADVIPDLIPDDTVRVEQVGMTRVPVFRTSGSRSRGGSWSGGGGEFGGGGMTGRWNAPSAAADHAALADVGANTAARAGAFEVSDLVPDIDVEETWVVVLPMVIIGSAVVAALYVVYSAPVLMAEIVLDVLLVSGLYRRLRKLERRSWLSTAVRRTWIPVGMTTVLVALSGFVIQRVAPHADSIGDILR